MKGLICRNHVVHHSRWRDILLHCCWTPDDSTDIWANYRSQLGCAPAIFGWNYHRKCGTCLHCPLYQVLTTNKWLSASALGRWPLIAGNLTLKCVGTLIMCPYMAGGRSRRGSPKAGTTVSYKTKRRVKCVTCSGLPSSNCLFVEKTDLIVRQIDRQSYKQLDTDELYCHRYPTHKNGHLNYSCRRTPISKPNL